MTTTERGGGLAGGAITLEERFSGLYKYKGSAGIQVMNTFQYDGGPGVGTFNKQSRVEVEHTTISYPLDVNILLVLE